MILEQLAAHDMQHKMIFGAAVDVVNDLARFGDDAVPICPSGVFVILWAEHAFHITVLKEQDHNFYIVDDLIFDDFIKCLIAHDSDSLFWK